MSRSPSSPGSAVPARLTLTAAAADRVRDHNLAAALAKAGLTPSAQVGDSVCLPGGHRLAVVRRSWVIEVDATVLEITLDWPDRGARPP